jgi:type IV pilus assembly protein PilY1
MKIPAQLATSLLSLGTLLGLAAHAQATNIAELPLKASVLAKPNVIFGLDDSGSMDWEVLLDTSSGLFWWDGDDGWNSATGKPTRSTGSDSDRRSYLFPVGSATGGQLYAYNSTNGRALPPTNQFAWVRSSKFNPVYYDSKVTYKPWAPAYLDGVSLPAYPNASPSAALSHPLYTSGPALAVNAVFDSSHPNWSTDGWRFRLQAGMKVPAGAYVSAASATSDACDGSSAKTLTTELTVGSGRACYASIPYYPATFWSAETCTVGADCVLAPDGVTTLKRYEIKAGNSFPSGRSYADEIQNFANWFTYYRKRKLMLAASMGQVLETLTGLRLGVVPFNEHAAVTMRDTDAASASQNGREIAGRFYKNALDAEGTPTHATVKYIAGEFNTNTSVVQYACQRNSMFVVTDGFSNTTSITPPSWDSGKSAANWGSGAPYQTTTDGTLADLALRYYTNRLRAGSLAAGKVPPSGSTAPNADKNPDLHINTYAITLGVRGTLWPNTASPFDIAPAWTTPVADDPSMIDDQWHATINGRGLMFLATTPDETTAGIRAVLTDILSQTGAQGGIAVSTVNLPRGDNKAYFGTYNPAGWAGDLTANAIDPATGSVNTTATWSAAAKLAARDWTTRVIATSNGSSGMAFTAANVGPLVNPGGIYGSDAAVIDYLRGSRSGEGTAFRSRTSLMGAVINSEPVVSREDGVVYVASGEGMLHAFDTSAGSAGQELWAFVPSRVLPALGESVERGYAFGTKLDGSPVIGKVGTSKRLLVAGMGVAGRGYYALDVSSPRGLSEAGLASKLKWEFPAAGDSSTQAKVGQTLGRPVIVKTETDGYVVLLTSGYNSTADGKGRLWMLNADTGAVIKEFVVAAGTLANEAGLAHVTAFGESNATVRYVYGGDLLGNVWRFDLKLKDDPAKLATLLGPAGDAQPVTAAPELLMHEGQRIVYLGTGRLLDITDFGSAKVQSIYAIADGPTLTNARATLVQQTYDRATDSLSSNAVNWATQRGWFVDLPAGEQINTRPTIAYGGLAFVSNINGGADCSASSYLYVVGALDGKKFPGTTFVGTLVSATSNSSGVTALLTTGQKIVGAGQDADGKPWERQITSGSPILPGKNAWIEIRR